MDLADLPALAAKIERLLAHHNALRRGLGLDEIEQELFAVCPVACLDLGEKIAVAHEQESETALKARVRELADSYKVPSSSFALRKITQIPRASSGKIDYARLKDLVSV